MVARMAPRSWGGWRLQLAALALLHVVALALFTDGFLLRRAKLPHRSQNPATENPIYDRLVWVVIDALRYDFVVADGRYEQSCQAGVLCHQGHMPYLQSLLDQQPGAARAFMYVAEAPTTTVQRLAAMTAGSLPTFFDISSSFTTSPLAEDNLVDQLRAHGHKLALLGDTTWHELFPTQFNISHTYPCFNVKDLHTVDDGVWEHLLPLVAQPADWDVLVAHYLGVDHVGHSWGVHSVQMADKLRQMDDQMHQLVAALVGNAGPGQDYEHTLLLIAGDHGQTLGGNHGGGSPEEVDSVLVAIDVAALRAGGSAAPEQAAACRAGCTCGDEANQCADDLLQVDAVPTLAAMLGLPIPFGNMGTVSPELWAMAAAHAHGQAEAPTASLAAVLRRNADQISAYLAEHAALGVLSQAEHAALGQQYQLATEAATESREHLQMLQSFMATATDVARQHWTQFRLPSMMSGLLVFAIVLILHLWLLKPSGGWFWRPVMLAGVLAVHTFGIFSFFFVLGEGAMVCCLVAASVAVLAGCAIQSSRDGGTKATIALQATGALVADGLLCALGSRHHTGEGFWRRLTQNLTQPHDTLVDLVHSLRDQLLSSFGSRHFDLVLAWHLATCTLPLLAFSWAATSQRWAGQSIGVRTRWLVAAAFCTVAGYHLHVFLRHDRTVRDATAGAMQLLSGTLSRVVSSTTTEAVIQAATPLTHVARLPALGTSIDALLDVPLSVLLPRATYVLCSSAAAFSILGATFRGRTAAPAALASCQAILLVLLLQVSHDAMPIIALLAIVEVVLLAQLLRRHQLPASGAEVGALLALVQAQMFFVTGHLCEFAGLQYTAGFVGFQEFDLCRAAAMMVVETFGGMLLVMLALPKVLQLARPPAPRKAQPAAGLLGGALLGFSCVRSANAAVATLSAAIQKRHLYVWALFAPRFVFEAAFLLVSDAALLLLAGWSLLAGLE